MRRYETIFIIDPDVSSDENRDLLFDRLKNTIQQQNGLLALLDEWGTRNLAYAIKKRVRGYYVRLDYCGTGTLVDEIERFFRIDDRILKYMTVLLEKDVDIERVREEIALAEAERDEAIQEVPDPEETVSEVTESEDKAVEPEGETEVSEGEAETSEGEADVSENDTEETEIESETSESETVETEEDVEAPESKVDETENEAAEPESETVQPESEAEELEGEAVEPENDEEEK